MILDPRNCLAELREAFGRAGIAAAQEGDMSSAVALAEGASQLSALQEMMDENWGAWRWLEGGDTQ